MRAAQEQNSWAITINCGREEERNHWVCSIPAIERHWLKERKKERRIYTLGERIERGRGERERERERGGGGGIPEE